MDLESLGGLTVHIILSKLAPQDAASVACVSKRFRNWASDDLLWSRFCADDLDLSSPLDPLDNPMPSFKVQLLNFTHLTEVLIQSSSLLVLNMEYLIFGVNLDVS